MVLCKKIVEERRIFGLITLTSAFLDYFREFRLHSQAELSEISKKFCLFVVIIERRIYAYDHFFTM